MRKLPALTLCLLTLLPMLAACSAVNGSTTEPQGKGSARTFDARDFDGVILSGSDDVNVTYGTGFSVVATGTEEVLNDLRIEVENGVLNVGRKSRSGGWSWNERDKGAVVAVTLPVMRTASLKGSGDLTVDRSAEDRLDVSLAGSGDIRFTNAKASAISVNLAGSGDVNIAGIAKTADYSLAGSGNIEAAELKSETLKVSLAGSGDTRGHASQSADVSLIGSGDVTISGTRNCKSSKIGSGEVKCAG